MKTKIILGLSLIVPLPGTALNLEGNKTYDNEVNINFDENGINIERNSETTFNKDVTINSKKEKNPSSTQNIGLLSNIGNQGNSATTQFNGNLTINMDFDDTSNQAIGIFGGDTVTVNGTTTLSTTENMFGPSIAIQVSNKGKLLLNGSSIIKGVIGSHSKGLFETKKHTDIIGSILAFDSGAIKLHESSDITGDVYASESGVIELHGSSKIKGELISDDFGIIKTFDYFSINGNITAINSGQIDLDSNSNINGNIMIGELGKINIQKGTNFKGNILINDSGKLNIRDKISIEGDISVAKHANLNMEKDSTIKGNIINSDSGIINIRGYSNVTGSILNSNSGTINIIDNSNITGNIFNSYSGTIDIKGDSNITGNIFNSYSGTFDIKGDSNITGNINVDQKAKLSISGKSLINGDIFAQDNGQVNLDLSSGSKLLGTVKSSRQDDSHIAINLADNVSWEITQAQSYVNTLSGSGNIKFTNDISNNSYGNLMIDNLSGNHNFVLRMNNLVRLDRLSSITAAQQNDKIIILKSAEGNHKLNINNDGSTQTAGNEKITLIEIKDNAKNTAKFTLANKIELGGYTYKEISQQGNNWVLSSPQSNISTTANASAGFFNSNYLMSYIENQTLLKRLGDMRNSGNVGDVWLRGFTGKLDSFSGKKLSKFDMNYHGFQFGIDKQLSESSPFVIGAFVGQTYGNPDYNKGDGSLKSFNTGLYATYLNNSGWYIDSVAKYARVKNQFKVKDTANDRVHGNSHTNGLSLSLETGKKLNFNNYYFEPQLQLSYSRQNGTTFNATNGLKVNLGDYNSLLGRTSALVGYQINSENSAINIYAKTGFVREFSGDTFYKLNNNKESHSFKGNWWNNGLGINTQINKTHNFYLDLENSTGNRFDLIQANGGYRYSF